MVKERGTLLPEDKQLSRQSVYRPAKVRKMGSLVIHADPAQAEAKAG